MPAGRWRLLLLLALAPLLSGCLVIEKKTLVLVIPPDSKEVRMYYVFEGLSVLDGNSSNLQQAKAELDNLKQPGFGFFVTGAADSKNPLLEDFRFDDLRFFVDSSRERRLCADRRVLLLKRDKFARLLNGSIQEGLKEKLSRSVEEVQEDIRQLNKEVSKPETADTANGMGMGALLKVIRGLGQIALKFDAPSIRRLRAATNEDFQWVRFEKDTVRLVLPITQECAQKILADRDIVAWVKEMQTLVEPLSVASRPEGLALVLGKSPIRLTYTDPRKHNDNHERDLFEHVGSPDPVFLRGKKASAETLIKEFIAEAKKKL
jgi:hypothetical protein